MRCFVTHEKHGEFSPSFVVQVVKRLRDQDPRVTPALQWLEEQLIAAGNHFRRDGSRRAPATRRDQRHGAQHRHEHAPDFGRELARVLRRRQPRGCGICASTVIWPAWISQRAICIAAPSRRCRVVRTHRARNCTGTDRRHASSADSDAMKSASAIRDITCSAADDAPSNVAMGYRAPLGAWRSALSKSVGPVGYIAAVLAVAAIILVDPAGLAVRATGCATPLLMLCMLGTDSGDRCGGRTGESGGDAWLRRNDAARSRAA